jgi:Uma2 family endonuclease
MPAKQKQVYYTYENYLTWDDGNRYELINGERVLLASPRPKHQLTSNELSRQLSNYCQGSECKVFTAPFDLKISIDTVIQPDILVICETIDLNEVYEGTPLLVIEVLSTSTMKEDLTKKLLLYMKLGVKYYLIVDMEDCLIHVNTLVDMWYKETKYKFDNVIKLEDFNGLELSLKDLVPLLQSGKA